MRSDGVVAYYKVQHVGQHGWCGTALDHVLFGHLSWDDKQGEKGDRRYLTIILAALASLAVPAVASASHPPTHSEQSRMASALHHELKLRWARGSRCHLSDFRISSRDESYGAVTVSCTSNSNRAGFLMERDHPPAWHIVEGCLPGPLARATSDLHIVSKPCIVAAVHAVTSPVSVHAGTSAPSAAPTSPPTAPSAQPPDEEQEAPGLGDQEIKEQEKREAEEEAQIVKEHGS